MQRQTRRARPRGLTLIGTCTALAIAGILTIAALRLVQNARADAVAEELSLELIGSLRYAKTEAAARNQGVRLSVYESRAGGCYLVHTGDRSDCRCEGSDSANCSNGAEALQVVFLPADEPVQLTANANSILFNARNATTVSGGSLCIVPSRGKEVRHVVDIEGNVRTCTAISPTGVCEPC
jgi:type IV fimbrial biogenesis protein FimT